MLPIIRKSSRGFTLIELLVVIAIIGVMVGLSGATMSKTEVGTGVSFDQLIQVFPDVYEIGFLLATNALARAYG